MELPSPLVFLQVVFLAMIAMAVMIMVAETPRPMNWAMRFAIIVTFIGLGGSVVILALISTSIN